MTILTIAGDFHRLGRVKVDLLHVWVGERVKMRAAPTLNVGTRQT